MIKEEQEKTYNLSEKNHIYRGQITSHMKGEQWSSL